MRVAKFVVQLVAFSLVLSVRLSSASQPSGPPQGVLDIGAKFTASGSMGDAEEGEKYVQLLEACRDQPHSGKYCIKVSYAPGPQGWAGIYWQNRADNWGDSRGTDFSNAGYKTVTFWARGQKGGEVVEFKTGGIQTPGKPYRDSFEATLGRVILSKDWEQYTIDLEGQNLSSVIGGFCWVASRAGNPQGLTFYLDDIHYRKVGAVKSKTTAGTVVRVLDIGNKFVPSGHMGDGELEDRFVKFSESSREKPQSKPYCMRIAYAPGPERWGGMYWQNRPDNWGDLPGTDFSKAGYNRVSFWARGENGGEMVEFKAGGIDDPKKRYRDSFEGGAGRVVLEKEWKQYSIDLKGKNLSSVIGGFCWVASRTANPRGLTFYLDDIQYQVVRQRAK